MKKRLQLSIYVLLAVLAQACSKSSPVVNHGSSTDTTKTTTRVFAKGADIGWLSQMEASGIKFYNSAGTQMD